MILISTGTKIQRYANVERTSLDDRRATKPIVLNENYVASNRVDNYCIAGLKILGVLIL
jgi:hypothetical protein